MIFSSDRDFTLWPEPGTELTIDLDGTSLELPIVGGTSSLNFQPKLNDTNRSAKMLVKGTKHRGTENTEIPQTSAL